MCLFHQNCPLLVSDWAELTVWVEGVLPGVQTTCQVFMCSTVRPTFDPNCEATWWLSEHPFAVVPLSAFLRTCSRAIKNPSCLQRPTSSSAGSPSFTHFFFYHKQILHTCNWSLAVRRIWVAILKLLPFCILYALLCNWCCACDDANLVCRETFATFINIEDCALADVISWNWSQALSYLSYFLKPLLSAKLVHVKHTRYIVAVSSNCSMFPCKQSGHRGIE